MIARVCADLGESYVEVVIDDDAALREAYGEEIPVTLVDGRRHDFWRVDEARLRAALSAAPPCNRVFGQLPERSNAREVTRTGGYKPVGRPQW